MATRHAPRGAFRTALFVVALTLLIALGALFQKQSRPGQREAAGTVSRTRDQSAEEKEPLTAVAGTRGRESDREPENNDSPEEAVDGQAGTMPPPVDPNAIVGIVLGEDRRPAPGTRVEAHVPFGSFVRERAPVTGTADDHGRFRLPVPRDTPFRLWAIGPENETASLPSVFAGDKVVLSLEAGRTLRVHTVLKGSHEPLAGVALSVEYAPDAGGPVLFDASATSDANGLAVIPDVPRGDVSVSGHAAPYCSEVAWVRANNSEPVDVVLAFHGGVRIRGHIYDRSTGLGVSGAVVVGATAVKSASDLSGAYILPPMQPGLPNALFKVLHPSYAPFAEHVRIPPEEGDVQRDVYLEPGSSASGLILDAFDQPVAGAQVLAIGAYSSGALVRETQRLTRTSDASGHFALAGLAADTDYFLFARSEARRGAGFFRSPGPGKTLSVKPISLRDESAVRGRVLFQDESQRPQVRIRLSWIASGSRESAPHIPIETTGVSPDGSFGFHALPSGLFLVSMEANGDAGQRGLEQVVHVPAGTVLDDIVFDLRPATRVTIEGRVTDASGSSVGQVEVRVLDGTTVLSSILTGSDGEFRFQLGGAGPWTVRVVDANGVYQGAEVTGILPDSGAVDIALQPLHTPFSLDGHLLDETGAPVLDAYVGLFDPKTGSRASRLGIPDEEGYFRIPNLEDKAYDLKIVDFQGLYEPLRIEGVQPGEPLALTVRRHR